MPKNWHYVNQKWPVIRIYQVFFLTSLIFNCTVLSLSITELQLTHGQVKIQVTRAQESLVRYKQIRASAGNSYLFFSRCRCEFSSRSMQPRHNLEWSMSPAIPNNGGHRIAPNLALLIISGRHLHTLRGVQLVVCTDTDRVQLQGGTTALYLGLQ